MGGKSKKQTSTSTVGPPQYIQDAYQGLVGQAQETAAQPFTPYTGQLVAGLTPEQTQGIAGVSAAQGQAQPYYGQSLDYWNQSAQGIAPTAFSGDALQQYMNPYQQQVIDATLANTAENDRRQQQDLTGNAITAGAWGGDRAGVAKAELARQQKIAGDSTLANLNSSNFAQALQTFQQQQGVTLGAQQADAARQAAAASGVANLGTTAQDSALKAALAQIQAGGVSQQNQQQQLSSDYDQFMQQQAYPFQSQGWLANLLTGIGSSAGSTSSGVSKGSGDSGIGSILGAGVSLASAAFSDERIKENIERVGETYDGQPIYRYNFKGDPKTQIGLIAQDVEQTHPGAVGDMGGVKMVDYKAATDDAARGVAGMEDAFADGGVVPYSGRVKGRIPDMQPIKGRTGLMQAPPAPALPGQTQAAAGTNDMSKMGGQLGGLMKQGAGLFGGSGSFDANTPRFDFQSGGQLFGPGFAHGGAVDMVEDHEGVFRPAYAWGGDIPVAETEDDVQRLERETGMVPSTPRAPAFFGRDTGYAESKPVVPVSGLAGVDPDLAARVNGMVTNSGGVLPGVRSGFRSPEEQAALRARYLRGEGPVAAPPGSSRHESGRAVDVALAGAPGTARRSDAIDHIDSVAPAWGLRQTVGSEPWHTEIDPEWQGPIQGRNSFPDSDPDAEGVVSAQARAPSSGVAAAGPRATAYAPEGGSGIQTTAFDGLKPSVTPAQATGVAAAKPVDADKGFGLGYLPKDVQMALIAAGLGMMGARGSGGQQIGQGGLAGLQFYMNAQEAKRKAAQDERDTARKTTLEDRDYGLRSRSTDISEKSLLQRAQEAQERLGLSTKQFDESARHNKVAEDKSKYQAIAGTGVGPDGDTVPGTYVFDQGSGEMVFKPGMVAGATKNPEADLQRKAEFDRLKDMNDSAEGARTIKQSVNNLRELRKGVGYSGMPMAGAASKVAGMAGYGGGQALESAATNFKLDLSTKLKGAISDKEQAMLNSATPGLGMSDSAANQTLATYEGVAERALERNKFYQTWRARNKTLAGADDAWDAYVNENPVVQADKNGTLALNRKNLGNWQKYVTTAPKPGQGAQPAAAATPSAGSPPAPAVEHLRANPALKADFDRKYGAGAADRVLNARADGGGVGGGAEGGSSAGAEGPQLEPADPVVTPGSVTIPDHMFASPRPAQPYRDGMAATDRLGNRFIYRDNGWAPR